MELHAGEGHWGVGGEWAGSLRVEGEVQSGAGEGEQLVMGQVAGMKFEQLNVQHCISEHLNRQAL